MTRAEPASRLGAVFVAVLGVLLAIAAIRTGSVQVASRDARDALVAVASEREVPGVVAARASLEGALARAPEDAELLELHGRWALRDAAQAADAAAARAANEVAARDFRAALAQRPRWPYAWAGLATALSGVDGDATAIAQAVGNASRYGRNERRVNAELAELWLSHRDSLPPLERAWDRVLASEPQQWIDRADRAGRGLTACSRPALPPAAFDRCVALGWLTATTPQG